MMMWMAQQNTEERNTAQKHANIPDRIINLIYSQAVSIAHSPGFMCTGDRDPVYH